jgi:hypothetical protein
MAVGFPPIPVFPLGIDSDATLFLVYNTSETRLASNNQAFSDEVEIVPVGDEEPEQWADNGFANVSGELFYYDSVQKNAAGKVYKFTRCARNLGGKKSRYNDAGTWVRGFVIAEHHNQLADAVIAIENFVGTVCDVDEIEDTGEDLLTLDCRIRQLEAEKECASDHDCPTVTLDFRIDPEASNNCEGTVAVYNVTIEGPFNQFSLDFGDGSSTVQLTGTHTYAPNASIDPVVTVSNDKCQIVQTPSARDNPEEPPIPPDDRPFEISIPPLPDFPPIIIPKCDLPEPTLTLPPIVFPCLDVATIGSLGGLFDFPSIIITQPSGNFPSGINITPVSLPSFISISPISLPSAITITPISLPSAITITPINLPSVITITPPVFPTITFDPINIPSLIRFDPPNLPSIISFSPIDIPTEISITPVDIPSEISITPVDIPSEISITPIDIPTEISITPVDIPSEISITPVDIPSEISITPIDIPTEISITPVDIPSEISITPVDIPSEISITPVDIPSEISITPVDIPSEISITPVDIPSIISFDSPPTISVDWGSPPTLSCVVTVVCPTGGGGLRAARTPLDGPSEPRDFIEIETADLGIPNEIKVVAPEIPDVKLRHDLPTEIWLRAPVISDIKIVGPLEPLPVSIDIVGGDEIPHTIEVKAENLPSSITLDASAVPEAIRLEVPADFPTTIRIDASDIPRTIQVVGIPDSIELKGHIPSEILLKAPENLEVPLVYKGGPIPIQFDMKSFKGEGDEDAPCFAIVPCRK